MHANCVIQVCFTDTLAASWSYLVIKRKKKLDFKIEMVKYNLKNPECINCIGHNATGYQIRSYHGEFTGQLGKFAQFEINE